MEFIGLLSYNPQKVIREKYLNIQSMKIPPSKLIGYMVLV